MQGDSPWAAGSALDQAIHESGKQLQRHQQRDTTWKSQSQNLIGCVTLCLLIHALRYTTQGVFEACHAGSNILKWFEIKQDDMTSHRLIGCLWDHKMATNGEDRKWHILPSTSTKLDHKLLTSLSSPSACSKSWSGEAAECVTALATAVLKLANMGISPWCTKYITSCLGLGELWTVFMVQFTKAVWKASLVAFSKPIWWWGLSLELVGLDSVGTSMQPLDLLTRLSTKTWVRQWLAKIACGCQKGTEDSWLSWWMAWNNRWHNPAVQITSYQARGNAKSMKLSVQRAQTGLRSKINSTFQSLTKAHDKGDWVSGDWQLGKWQLGKWQLGAWQLGRW